MPPRSSSRSGSLFRRRGEVDRAIAIHSRLRDHGVSDSARQGGLRARAGLPERRSHGPRRAGARGAGGLARRTAARRSITSSGIYEAQGDWAKALKIFHELPPNVQVERAQVAAHYLCELAEQALVQGEAERAGTLLRQARTHQAQLPRADILTARIADAARGRSRGAAAVPAGPGDVPGAGAGDHSARCSAMARRVGSADLLRELGRRLQRSGRVSPRQLAWLLATAVPPEEVARLPGVTVRVRRSAWSPPPKPAP